MWYFTWVLGLTAALSIGIINVMWFEAEEEFDKADAMDKANKAAQPAAKSTKAPAKKTTKKVAKTTKTAKKTTKTAKS